MTQIVTKFIENNAVTGAKIRLANQETLRGRNATNNGDVNILRVNTSNIPEFQTLPEANSALPIPSSPKQFATVEYIQNFVNGKIDAKDSVSYLADTNITGAFTAGNSSTPSTLSGTSQLVIDGKSFTGTDITTPRIRVALTGQTSALQNGIYDVTGATLSSFTLTRSSDFDGIGNSGGGAITSGAYFKVIAGTQFAGYDVLLTTQDPITLNTTALTFVKYPGTLTLVGGDGILFDNNNISVDLQTNSGLESSNPGNNSGQLRIKVDASSLEKDKSTAINTSNGSLISRRTNKQLITLSSTDITNQYVDLQFIVGQSSAIVGVSGGGTQFETIDYSVNYTGGTGGKTRINFLNGLATGGVSALAAGDIIEVQYTYLTL